MNFVLSSLAAILLRKRGLVALLNCVVAVCIMCVFIVAPLVCLQVVTVAFLGHTHLCALAVLVFLVKQCSRYVNKFHFKGCCV